MGTGAGDADATDCRTVRVTYRRATERLVEAELDRVPVDEVAGGLPVREFRWYRGQKHYSGWYHASTTGRMVAYESRLELARILIADTEPNALVTQFQRLERDIGKSLFTRAAFGRPQQPTPQGRRLLRDLETDRVRALMTASPPHDHPPAPPDDHVLEAAHAKFRTRRNPGPPTPFDDISVERIRITRPTLALLHDLLGRPNQEFYGAEVIARTGLDPGTAYPRLKRLEQAGWLTSRLEDDVTWMNRATPGLGPGKRRTFYTLTAEGHRAARHETQHRTAA